MQIRIREGAYLRHRGSFSDSIRQSEGMLLDVDTEHLFSDQFNTMPIPGVSDNGLRVFAHDVDQIVDDVRLGMGNCTYCGKCSPTENANRFSLDMCPHCNHRGIDPFVIGSKRANQGIEVGIQSALTRCFPRR